jgi:hypothetical protein
MNAQRFPKFLISAVIIAAGVWFGTSANFYNAALVSAFFGAALFSVCIIHLRIVPTLLDFTAMLSGTAVFALVDFRVLHLPPKIMAWFSFLGLSSILTLAVRLVWAPADKRRFHFLAFVPSLLFVSSDWFASTFLEWTERAHPGVFDLNLFSFDASLRVQFPFLLGQAFQMWHPFRTISLIVYIALPIPIAIVYSGHLLKRESRAIAAMLAFLVTGPIGIIFYNLLPAMGPTHIFLQDFPWHPIPFESVHRLVITPLAFAGPRNAIPSLHMGWVLLAWWFSRGLSLWQRAIVAFFVFFTICGTMGTGEHYFIDLIAAFPFAVLIESLCLYELPWRSSYRLFSAVSSLALLLAWLTVLRFSPHVFLISPILPWLACILTVACSVFLDRKLTSSFSAHASVDTTQPTFTPSA